MVRSFEDTQLCQSLNPACVHYTHGAYLAGHLNEKPTTTTTTHDAYCVKIGHTALVVKVS